MKRVVRLRRIRRSAEISDRMNVSLAHPPTFPSSSSRDDRMGSRDWKGSRRVSSEGSIFKWKNGGWGLTGLWEEKVAEAHCAIVGAESLVGG